MPGSYNLAEAEAARREEEEITECELCGKTAPLIERATDFCCAECAEEYGGGSDYSDRMAERRQMGLCDF